MLHLYEPKPSQEPHSALSPGVSGPSAISGIDGSLTQISAPEVSAKFLPLSSSLLKHMRQPFSEAPAPLVLSHLSPLPRDMQRAIALPMLSRSELTACLRHPLWIKWLDLKPEELISRGLPGDLYAPLSSDEQRAIQQLNAFAGGAPLAEGVAEVLSKSPYTCAQDLHALAQSGDASLRFNVLKNPNTAPATQAWLAQYGPIPVREQIASSPFTAPEVLHLDCLRETLVGCINLAVNPNTPAIILEELSQNPHIAVSHFLARNLSTPVWVLGGMLSEDQCPKIVMEALINNLTTRAKTSDLSPEREQALTELLQQAWERQRSAPYTVSSLELEWDVKIMQAFASNPLLPLKPLESLMRQGVATIDASVITNLASRARYDVIRSFGQIRSDVALLVSKNKQATPALLTILSQHGSAAVRCSVAAHQKVSNPVLERFARDTDVNVRFAVATNPVTSSRVLAQLVGDVPKVQFGLAQNPNTPTEVLDKLAKIEGISIKVAQNPATSHLTLSKLAKIQMIELRKAVARHPNTPEQSLRLLAQDTFPSVRAAVASHSKIPVDRLTLLSVDIPEVRLAVAESSQTPPEILLNLAQSPNPAIQRAVLENQNTPLNTLISLSRNPEVAPYPLVKLAKNKALPATEALKYLHYRQFANVLNADTLTEVTRLLRTLHFGRAETWDSPGKTQMPHDAQPSFE